MITEKHDFVVADPNGFKKGVSVAEGAVRKRYAGFVNADQVTVKYAVSIFCHSLVAFGIQNCP